MGLSGGQIAIFWFLGFGFLFWSCHCRQTFGFDLHHKFSEPVKEWMSLRHGIGYEEWPESGSEDYYLSLVHHDHNLRGRGISEIGAPLTFADGNTTFKLSSLGFLHYSFVTLGTPNVTFLVALDTGSDLFWVPCDCSRCAPTLSMSYGFDFELNIYNSNASSTSKHVSCSNSLCQWQSECSRSTGHCPYQVSYVSDDTSSSGVLIEDVLYLTTDDSQVVKAPITFGCGQVQSGSFLDAAAPNGLFGLGVEKLSVPSILSGLGLIHDSFSMCFGQDGIGRIRFGDNGSSDQEETPFNLDQSYPTYNISITDIQVGSSSIKTGFSALFDSGTSFTYLADPIYTRLAKSVPDKRHQPDSRLPFEYCYNASSNVNSNIPDVSLLMQGGSRFPIYDPIISFSTQGHIVYCLAVVKGEGMNIIGQNFMTGLRIVFDREKLVLGWKKFNCYDVENTSTLDIKPPYTVPPSSSVAPDNYAPEDTKTMGNTTQVSIPPPPPLSDAARLFVFGFTRALSPLFLLFVALF
ncbi:aspartyl protease family protein 1 isoform X2 [Amborella trichopoda]|uniref:aspartyl protease family protein 1 isoform X2 n=1 Tax=Amborella trichopoda TaxID=13333 RepID=UPI0009BE6E87|nr:aspartyl protease family protein 1 isoform X2 [Amborella trichopoda]|eukprot:XP_020532231.1 aspartyl protease family protein 1 isoform X2 [Amborella trichopoda]